MTLLAGQSMPPPDGSIEPITFRGFDALALRRLCHRRVLEPKHGGSGGLEGNFPIVSLSGE